MMNMVNVVRTLSIQPTLVTNTQVVIRYVLGLNRLDEAIKNYPKNVHQNRYLSQNFEIAKNNETL